VAELKLDRRNHITAKPTLKTSNPDTPPQVKVNFGYTDKVEERPFRACPEAEAEGGA
jgi:hypothetical protein